MEMKDRREQILLNSLDGAHRLPRSLRAQLPKLIVQLAQRALDARESQAHAESASVVERRRRDQICQRAVARKADIFRKALPKEPMKTLLAVVAVLLSGCASQPEA